MYNKILLATDGSENAKKASEHAIGLAAAGEDAKLEIVYVIDGEKAKSDVLSSWNSADPGTIRKERVSEIEKQAKKAGVNYKVEILHGEPGPTIVDYANKNSFDLVVIGSRGLNALQELVLGSVSHKVAKRANCPVLIVKL